MREKNLKEEGIDVKLNSDFSTKLVNFLLNGLVKFVDDEKSPLFPKKITAERFNEIDKICEICEKDFQEENKFFVAFANVLRKVGFANVTLEKIADELNMVKSSLYFYFENKNEMIKTLIQKELSLLEEIVRENSAEAKSFLEFTFIMMRTVLSFLRIRSSLLPVLGWILQVQNSEEKLFEGEQEIQNAWEKMLTEPVSVPELGFQLKTKQFIGWLGCIPCALTLFCDKHSISYETSVKMLKDCFVSIQFGIDEDLLKW